MPEQGLTDPEEGFTFVDKRHIVSDDEVFPDADFISDNDTAETLANEDDSASHSIYEVAAYCTGMLINEGFIRLGLIADPKSGKAVMDLPSARVAIDCVAALANIIDEPSSTLPEPVRREVKRTLNDLRLNYIERKSS